MYEKYIFKKTCEIYFYAQNRRCINYNDYRTFNQLSSYTKAKIENCVTVPFNNIHLSFLGI